MIDHSSTVIYHNTKMPQYAKKKSIKRGQMKNNVKQIMNNFCWKQHVLIIRPTLLLPED